MTCATCGKQPIRETVATKTRKVGKHVIVEVQRQALVCDCGVLAWDPPMQSPSPVLPYPARPWEHPNYPSQPSRPYVSPNMSTPWPQRLPSTTCSPGPFGIATNVAHVTYQDC